MKAKRSFILSEILIAFSLFCLVVPFFFSSRNAFKQEVKRLCFHNQFEQAYKELAFHLYNHLYEPLYFSKIAANTNVWEQCNYKPLIVGNTSFATRLHFKTKPSNGKHHQVQVRLEVLNLPFKKPQFSSNYQNLYLKK